MARFTKAQQKRAALAMLQKAEKLVMVDSITLDDFRKVLGIKQRCLKRLGYDPKSQS